MGPKTLGDQILDYVHIRWQMAAEGRWRSFRLRKDGFFSENLETVNPMNHGANPRKSVIDERETRDDINLILVSKPIMRANPVIGNIPIENLESTLNDSKKDKTCT